MSKFLPKPEPDRCWSCNYPIEVPFQLNTVEMLLVKPPVPGDISICAACGAFGEYDTLLKVVKPSLKRMRAIINTPRLMEMQAELLSRKGM